MSKLLTLAIAETWQDNFGVVAYCIDAKKYLNLQIPKEKINNWDVFSVTEAEVNTNDANLQDVMENGHIVEQWTVHKGREFLREKAISANYFFANNYRNSIVRVESIDCIHHPEWNNNMLRCRVDYSSGKPYTKKLCKDWRWVKYWEHLDPESYDLKIKHWLEYLNNHEVYLIHYRHYFSYPRNGVAVWIQGIHCF